MTTPGRPLVVAEFRSTFSHAVGGPDKTIFHAAARHDPDRVRIVPIYLVPEGDPVPAVHALAEATGVDPILVPDRDRLGRRALSRLSALLREHACRVLHAHDFKTDFLGLWLRRRDPSLRILATAHGWSRPAGSAKLAFYNAVDKRVLRRYPLVCTVSRATRAILEGHGVDRNRIRVLPNGVDIDVWRPGRPAGDPGAGPRIGMVGRLSGDKDVGLLIAAFGRIAATRPDARLVIVGDGPEAPGLRRAAESAPAGDRIDFMGHRSDLLELYRGFDVFVLSSRAEGMPNAVLEAMAVGLPVVATRVGGVPELVRDGEDGILVPPGDAAGLAAGITRVLDDPALAARLGTAARHRVESGFSFSGRVAALERLYEEAAGTVPAYQGTGAEAPGGGPIAP